MVLALHTQSLSAVVRPEGPRPAGQADHTRETETASAARLAPERASGPRTRPPADSEGPSDSQLIAAAAVTTAVLGDPMALALALQSQVRDASTRDTEMRVRSNEREGEVADALRLEQLDEAAKRLEQASKKAPPWVKKLIGAVLTAVGTIASIAGGAGVALIAVGAALTIAAKIVERIMNRLAEAGIISEKAAMIVSTVVKIAAAVAAAVVGQVGGLADAAKVGAEVATTAAEVAKSVISIVQASADIAFAGVDMHSSIRTFQAQMANIMAEEWGLELDGTVADSEAAAETYGQIHRAYARMARVANAALETQREGALQAARSVA